MFVILCILSCYYNNSVSIFTIGYQLDEFYSFSGCLPFCVKLVPYSVIAVYSVYGEINMMNDDGDDESGDNGYLYKTTHHIIL